MFSNFVLGAQSQRNVAEFQTLLTNREYPGPVSWIGQDCERRRRQGQAGIEPSGAQKEGIEVALLALKPLGFFGVANAEGYAPPVGDTKFFMSKGGPCFVVEVILAINLDQALAKDRRIEQ